MSITTITLLLLSMIPALVIVMCRRFENLLIHVSESVSIRFRYWRRNALIGLLVMSQLAMPLHQGGVFISLKQWAGEAEWSLPTRTARAATAAARSSAWELLEANSDPTDLESNASRPVVPENVPRSAQPYVPPNLTRPTEADANDTLSTSRDSSTNTMFGGVTQNSNNSSPIFEQVQTLTPNNPVDNYNYGGRFGNSIAFANDTLFIGAPLDDEISNDGGAVYVFERGEGGNWQQVQKLVVTNSISNAARFGYSIAVSDGIAVIGAPGDKINNDDRTGSVFIFTFSSSRFGVVT